MIAKGGEQRGITVQEFWHERKEAFVRLKQWEEERKSRTFLFGKIVVGMLESIIHRMANSSFENDTFGQYFANFIKLQKEHSNNILKNANKHFDPMHANY